MNRSDFTKLIGAEGGNAEYLPVACLLRAGYGCAGYYNQAINANLTDTCVLANARLVEFRHERAGGQATIEDFNEFLQEIVQRVYQADESSGEPPETDPYVKSIPLAAIPMNEISDVYPVAHITKMMRVLQKEGDSKRVPAFFDFDNKSIILKILRAKLW
jgi:hypothetical protein